MPFISYLYIYLSYATEIRRFIRDFCEKLCASKLDKLKETDKFLETYNVSKMNHKETENLNRPITTKEIKSVIKMLPTTKSPRPDGFIGKFYQVFKEELTPIFLSLGRFLTIISSNMLSVLFSLFSLSGTPIMHILVYSVLSHKSLSFSSLFFFVVVPLTLNNFK